MKLLLPIITTALLFTNYAEAIWKPDQYKTWNIILGSKVNL